MASNGTNYECKLSSDVLSKAKKELKEDPSTRLIEVKNLATRLEKVPGLQPCLDVSFLLKFLRARKFDQQRAFDLVKNYYQIRVDEKDMFEDLCPSRIRHMIDDGVVEVLQGRDSEGCALVVIRAGRWNPDRYPISDLPKTLYLVLNHLLLDEETQVNGVHIINNMEGMTWKHGSQVSPSLGKKVTSIIQNVVPLRFKRLDYVNEPTFFDVIFAIIKQFLREKFIKRLHMNGKKVENLQKSISAEILTTDLGGKVEPFSNKAWKESFLGSDPLFIEDNKFGFHKMDVSKTKAGADADMAGLGGTFKKLDI